MSTKSVDYGQVHFVAIVQWSWRFRAINIAKHNNSVGCLSHSALDDFMLVHAELAACTCPNTGSKSSPGLLISLSPFVLGHFCADSPPVVFY